MPAVFLPGSERRASDWRARVPAPRFEPALNGKPFRYGFQKLGRIPATLADLAPRPAGRKTPYTARPARGVEFLDVRPAIPPTEILATAPRGDRP